MDRTGKVVLDKDLERSWEFSEGLAVAMRKGENLWGYIDTRGEFVITPRFATSPKGYVYPFSDGFAMIEVMGRFGYIDGSGSFVISPQFLDGRSFGDGMARVVIEGPCVYFPAGGCGFANPVYPGSKNRYSPSVANPPSCKCTFIDRSGHVITTARFEGARDFSEGLAPVRLNGAWGFIDKTGAVVIDPKFENAERFSSGLAKVLVNGNYGYIDKNGKVAIQPQFKEADAFSEGLAVVGDGTGRFWYIDQQGKRAFAGEFPAASPFFKGLAHVKLRRTALSSVTHSYIDTK